MVRPSKHQNLTPLGLSNFFQKYYTGFWGKLVKHEGGKKTIFGIPAWTIIWWQLWHCSEYLRIGRHTRWRNSNFSCCLQRLVTRCSRSRSVSLRTVSLKHFITFVLFNITTYEMMKKWWATLSNTFIFNITTYGMMKKWWAILSNTFPFSVPCSVHLKTSFSG